MAAVATTESTDNRLHTPLTELLDIDHPVLLAPMGDTAGGRLAAAVSNAGGLGFIGGGYGDPAWLERELSLAGAARIGIGFITFALDGKADALQVALDATPVAIQLSFGDPRPYAAAVKAAGALLVCQVQTAAEIDQALEAGADVLVAQGSDGGGHGRPGRATMGLVPSLVDRAGDIPVAAAGGIVDGRGLAAALALGAAGITMGTRFLASAEAISTPAERQALVDHGADETIRTPVIDLVRGPAWPDGYDGRAVRNDLIDRWHDDLPGVSEHADELRADYHASAPDDYRMRALWAGEGLDLITDLPPAATIVDRVIADAVHHLRRAAASIDPTR